MTAIRFITHRERNEIQSLMLKKSINDKHICRKCVGFHKPREFRLFMLGKKVIDESHIKELIVYLTNYGEGYNIYG